MTDRELMQQAMDALEDACGGRCNAENNPCWQRDIANALRGRVEQLKPLRPWVGLTNQQIMDCTHHMAKENGVWIVTDNGLLEFAHILEETIRSKNK